MVQVEARSMKKSVSLKAGLMKNDSVSGIGVNNRDLSTLLAN